MAHNQTTIADIAKAAKVSAGTVSNALNDRKVSALKRSRRFLKSQTNWDTVKVQNNVKQEKSDSCSSKDTGLL